MTPIKGKEKENAKVLEDKRREKNTHTHTHKKKKKKNAAISYLKFFLKSQHSGKVHLESSLRQQPGGLIGFVVLQKVSIGVRYAPRYHSECLN